MFALHGIGVGNSLNDWQDFRSEQDVDFERLAKKL